MRLIKFFCVIICSLISLHCSDVKTISGRSGTEEGVIKEEKRKTFDVPAHQDYSLRDDRIENDVYKEDVITLFMYKNQKTTKRLDPKKYKRYFIANKETQELFVNGDKTGLSIDEGSFLGQKIGSYIYFEERYTFTSSQMQKELGKDDSVIYIRKKFREKDVTQDPRATYLWIYEVIHLDTTKITFDEFLEKVIPIDDSVEKEKYIKKIKKQILSTKGRDTKEKLIQFTKKAVKDSKLWNVLR